MLAANGAVYYCGSRFNRNSTGRSRSNRAIDYRESRPVLMNVFYYLPNEGVILEWKTNMHHVTLANGRRLIDIDSENVIPALQDLQQRLADLAETDNDNGCLHILKLTFLALQPARS